MYLGNGKWGEPEPLPPIVCTTCNAREGYPCTQPTDTGRRNVSWFHLAREGRGK